MKAVSIIGECLEDLDKVRVRLRLLRTRLLTCRPYSSRRFQARQRARRASRECSTTRRFWGRIDCLRVPYSAPPPPCRICTVSLIHRVFLAHMHVLIGQNSDYITWLLSEVMSVPRGATGVRRRRE